jgi:hypothetical protein
MTDAGSLSALLAIPFFWQAILLVFAVLALGLLALVVRVARLNRNITVLEMRVTTLESRPLQPAPLPQKTALLKKTSLADGPSQKSAADAIIPQFSTDSMIETAISMIKAGNAADQIQLKLGIEPELLAILIQQHKSV